MSFENLLYTVKIMATIENGSACISDRNLKNSSHNSGQCNLEFSFIFISFGLTSPILL